MQRKFSTIVISLLVLAIAIFAGRLGGKYFGEAQRFREQKESSEKILARVQHLNVGDTLPNHKFEAIGGDSVWLRDLLTKKCVLTVVLPGCEDCLYEAQELKAAITDSNDARHFIFATWDNPRTFEDMKKEYGLTSPFLYDHKRAFFSNYDITTFQFNITLNEHGVVLDMLSGAMLKDDFEEIIKYNKRTAISEN